MTSVLPKLFGALGSASAGRTLGRHVGDEFICQSADVKEALSIITVIAKEFLSSN